MVAVSLKKKNFFFFFFFFFFFIFFFFFFFFKQKTAYEILNGDWSSDVCSSDLRRRSILLEAAVLSAVAGFNLVIVHRDMTDLSARTDRKSVV